MIKASDLQKILEKCGKITESHRSKDGLQSETKDDGSPVTIADKEASDFLVKELKRITPQYSVLSEEAWDGDNSKFKDVYWIVDPLDGTKEFINGSTDYTINVALIRRKEPETACIYHPPTETFYYAKRNGGAYSQQGSGELKPITGKLRQEQPTALLSRSHVSSEVELTKTAWPKSEIIRMGSALKFCKVAEGLADLYFRTGPTMEWDTAAGQLLCSEAGGAVINWDGETLEYGKSNRKNPGFICVANRNFLEETYTQLLKAR